MAAQAGLCLTWSETPEDTFSHGVAHMNATCVLTVVTATCMTGFMSLFCFCVGFLVTHKNGSA